MKTTKEVGKLFSQMMKFAIENQHEYITPEHFLYTLSYNRVFQVAFENCGGDVERLQSQLSNYFAENLTPAPSKEPKLTIGLETMMSTAYQQALGCQKDAIEMSHLLQSLLDLDESHAVYYIASQEVDGVSLLSEVCHYENEYGSHANEARRAVVKGEPNGGGLPDEKESSGEGAHAPAWKKYVECLNDTVARANPLIGRAKELERTIQILCRKDKNNPLHIGEAGIGKTAITYGLARLLNEAEPSDGKARGKGGIPIPDILLGAKIYAVDLGGMLAGTQFRGDFEKRLKEVMDGIAGETNAIVYLDEIHNIVGAGATSGGSFDASNLLKPYLAEGNVRFIGATTYEEYKKHFAKSKSLTRRFQNIDVQEPDEEEACQILYGLKEHYEQFHGVKYAKGVLEHAVSVSAKYMNERYLPDKAIDLIDEAGAYRRIHPLDQKTQTVGKDLIDDIVSHICNIPKQVVEKDEAKKLKVLDKNLAKKVFGQGEAIAQVVNAIKFSHAGLLDENKPLANLLFVGPTGVGKTEVARTLAAELGIALIRFDMSEYAEKHAVAKLIGSPAGYVGYEEGGLLTEAIRKKPHAVLLLDEIEKAHADIYNILLQVMDYATLTDNQGRKADFRHVVLIMTSNAGASEMGRESMGFLETDATSNAIMDEVKRVFQPEFRNRLGAIVQFNRIDDNMARLITLKKLDALRDKLSAKKVHFTVSNDAVAYIKSKGVSKEYGAREIDRIVNNEIKPLLVDRLLFGALKKGGECLLDYEDGTGFICR